MNIHDHIPTPRHPDDALAASTEPEFHTYHLTPEGHMKVQSQDDEIMARIEQRSGRAPIELRTLFASKFLPDGSIILTDPEVLRYFGKFNEDELAKYIDHEVPPMDPIVLGTYNK